MRKLMVFAAMAVILLGAGVSRSEPDGDDGPCASDILEWFNSSYFPDGYPACLGALGDELNFPGGSGLLPLNVGPFIVCRPGTELCLVGIRTEGSGGVRFTDGEGNDSDFGFCWFGAGKCAAPVDEEGEPTGEPPSKFRTYGGEAHLVTPTICYWFPPFNLEDQASESDFWHCTE